MRQKKGKWNGLQPPGVEPRTPLAWATSALPQSHDSQTTANPHNPQLVPPVQHIWRILRVGGRPAVVAQWQSTGGSSQRCPGFNSRLLPVFSLSSIFTLWRLNSFISSLRQDPLSNKKQTNKQQEQVAKKSSEWRQAHVGMEPSKTSQTRWEMTQIF